MTWLDNAIGWLSPSRGAERAMARRMMETMSYEAARKGRRTDGWITASTDADGASQVVSQDLRNRARDLVRNNAYASAAIDVKVTETIGFGITPEVKNGRLRNYWDAFVDNCDADGNLDFYGLQALIERCRMESGEVLIRFVTVERSRAEIRAGIIPLQVRVMEPDWLDHARDGRSDAGGFIRYGIEYTASGQVRGYWIYGTHPGESARSALGSLGLQSSFVPAEEILHVFRRLRAGQTRGVTDFAPVVLRMRDLDDYNDAEVMRKKIEACLAAFVTRPDGANSPIGSVSTDDEGRVEQLYPAMVQYLKPGEGIEFADPKASGGYADFQRFSLREIAAGLGIPYELMTGDLSQVNYSSYRAGLIRFRRRLEQDQWHVHIPQVCEPIFDRFKSEASVVSGSGAIGARTMVEWTPPRFELIDPLKETEAEIESVLAGFDTWDEVVRRRGWSATEQLDAIAAWQKTLTDRGIVLKSDMRTQVAQAPAVDTDEEDEEAA